MNMFHHSLVTLTFVAVSAHAGEPTSLNSINVRDSAQLVVNCRDESLPSQRAVGEVLETNNAAYVYSERERLVHTAHRQCMRGAPSVTFVRDTSVTTLALAMVDTAASQ